MKDTLNRLIRHESLSREEAGKVLREMAEGKYNLSQMAAFVTIYLMRAIKLEELQGFRDAMLELWLNMMPWMCVAQAEIVRIHLIFPRLHLSWWRERGSMW
jgi:anthranilate phosphoribosyltransferase